MLRMVPGILLFAALLPGCNGTDESKDPKESTGTDSGTTTTGPGITDADGDGVTPNDGDCDDTNAAVYPGVMETCDGLDNNCNGFIDEGLPDTDGDGLADCVDAETCDGIDNDGDGQVDEDFADSDHDGVADCAGTEICDGQDNNADGQVDEGFDQDGDGFTQCGTDTVPPDCDDSNADINPGTAETPDNRTDDDCDGMIDEGNWKEGQLAITEIMNNPDRVVDPQGEWFEIYNTSERRLILNGLIIESDPSEMHQITSDKLLMLEPGEFFLLAINGNDGTNGDVFPDYVYTDVNLSNESDTLSIWAGTVMLDQVVWDDGATMPDGSGASMMVDNGFYDATLNDITNGWCLAVDPWDAMTDFGSPGEDNGLCSTTDHDRDGFNRDQGDCDDTDPTIYPGAFESDPSKDNDCDGVVEWGPVAIPIVNGTSSLLTCDSLVLDGTGSYDPDGGTLSYIWTLVSAPGGSAKTSADILNPTSANPTFRPDLPGTYTFSLTVNDGGTNSLPVTVDAVIGQRTTNSDPLSNAGVDQSYDESVTCTSSSYGRVHTCSNCSDYTFTLDGSGSSDPDGDDLGYNWTVLSGSYASVSNATVYNASVTISGVPATYGSTTPDYTTLQLQVTDCMGAVAYDQVMLTLNCTGQ